jgi:Asp-tRNA(Asn)/Glu-tRNA(Gln) amidotransferase A subunit family amidase
MEYLTSMSACEAAAAIRAKEISSLELVDACLRRIEDREPSINAWAFLDADRARAAARACDDAPASGPLHGVPVGIKDVIDTLDMPTSYGSVIHEGHRPLRDAACVTLIQRAGGIVLGKTVTTEFAMYRPSKTANPHNIAHTPGGSSSGSAAAVADRHVPIALGTQTSGSLIRPAAYCGVIGYKPTFGTFAIEGLKTLAASLDTLGMVSRSLDDLLLMFEVLAGTQAAAMTKPACDAKKLKLGLWHPPFASAPAPDADGLHLATLRLAGAGIELAPISMPASFSSLNDVHASLMAYEVARNHLYEYEPSRRTSMSPLTTAVIEQGWKVSFDSYLGYREATRNARIVFEQIMQDFDAILVPAAPGEAPAIASTGDPVFNRMWSLLGVPALTLPVAKGPYGLPLGVQLIGRCDQDLRLLEVARALEPLICG